MGGGTGREEEEEGRRDRAERRRRAVERPSRVEACQMDSV